jgi:hypothetical protein
LVGALARALREDVYGHAVPKQADKAERMGALFVSL